MILNMKLATAIREEIEDNSYDYDEEDIRQALETLDNKEGLELTESEFDKIIKVLEDDSHNINQLKECICLSNEFNDYY